MDTGPASPVRPSDTGRDERYDIEEPEAIHPLVDLEELDLADERGGGERSKQTSVSAKSSTASESRTAKTANVPRT